MQCSTISKDVGEDPQIPEVEVRYQRHLNDQTVAYMYD